MSAISTTLFHTARQRAGVLRCLSRPHPSPVDDRRRSRPSSLRLSTIVRSARVIGIAAIGPQVSEKPISAMYCSAPEHVLAYSCSRGLPQGLQL